MKSAWRKLGRWQTLPLVIEWYGYNKSISKCMKLTQIWGIGGFCKPKKKTQEHKLFNAEVTF